MSFKLPFPSQLPPSIDGGFSVVLAKFINWFLNDLISDILNQASPSPEKLPLYTFAFSPAVPSSSWSIVIIS